MACLVRIPQVNVEFLINQCCRIPALLIEGTRNPDSTGLWHWLNKTGILMLLAGYKIISFRKNMNRTWAIYSICPHCRCDEHLPFRITVLARDSTIYFVILFGRWLDHMDNDSYWSWLIIVGLVLTIADAIYNFLPVSPLLWVNSHTHGLYHSLTAPYSPTMCITSIAVRYICFIHWNCANLTA